MNRFQSAAKKVAEEAPSDVTTIIGPTRNTKKSSIHGPLPSTQIQNRNKDLEKEFEVFMAELTEKGLISNEEEEGNEQVIVGEVEGAVEWKQVRDSGSQRNYFWNTQTDEVSWENPQEEKSHNQSQGLQDSTGSDKLPIEEYDKMLVESIKSFREVNCSHKEGSFPCKINAFKDSWEKFKIIAEQGFEYCTVCPSCSENFRTQISPLINQMTLSLIKASNEHPQTVDSQDNMNEEKE